MPTRRRERAALHREETALHRAQNLNAAALIAFATSVCGRVIAPTSFIIPRITRARSSWFLGPALAPRRFRRLARDSFIPIARGSFDPRRTEPHCSSPSPQPLAIPRTAGQRYAACRAILAPDGGWRGGGDLCASEGRS